MNELTTGGSLGSIGEEQINIIKRTICKGASDDELAFFVAQCKRTGLDPFSRQIYSVPRKEKDGKGGYVTRHVTQVSIDGLRLIAERTGKYYGQLGPFWCGEDGEWKEVWLKKDPPLAAKVGVIRSDFKEPLFAVARLDTYKQNQSDGTPTFFWKKMPDLMLGKCAESLALRRAFPQELSGLYISEEMCDTTEFDVPKTSRVAQIASQIKEVEVFPLIEQDEATKALPRATDSQKEKIIVWYEKYDIPVISLERYVGDNYQQWTAIDAESLMNLAKMKSNEAKTTGSDLKSLLKGAIE